MAALMRRIVLASSSPYRRKLLQRLQLDFVCRAPDIDETPLESESPEQMIHRLSLAKAMAIAQGEPDALVIASDQAGFVKNRILGKPGTEAAARQQLASISGQQVRFLTGLCVLDSANMQMRSAIEECTVTLRELGQAAIDDYVNRDRPLDCAGSFRVEGLGISLFSSVRLSDPTALEGLPLIRLTGFLSDFGIEILAGRPGV
jgi:MAF protein